MRLYRLQPEQVSKNTRHTAKNRFVFPQFYGSVWFQCAPALWEAIAAMDLRVANKDDPEKSGSGISLYKHLKSLGVTELGDCMPQGEPAPGTFARLVYEAEKQMWEKDFPVYTQWKKDWWNAYLKEGGFTTLTGFRIEGDMRKNVVINIPVQSAAFHCLLWSLIQVQRWLFSNRMRSRIVGEIHDSLVLDCDPNELDEVLHKCREIMVNDIRKHWPWISIPLEVEAEVAGIDRSWYEKSKYEIR
jgi:hypothetical protein